MGYTTKFTGHVDVTPPLNATEVAFLKNFADEDNRHDPGAPGSYCDWQPTEDGAGIEWNRTEKFRYAEEWMRYLIDQFLKQGAVASTIDDPQFAGLTFDHIVNGTIEAQGEERDDLWRLVVTNNVVSRVDPSIVYPDPNPTIIWPEVSA
jgi:hypothetical protein